MKKRLEDEIEFIRKEMLDAADKEGLSADRTMKLSEKLDALINRFEEQKGDYGGCPNDGETTSYTDFQQIDY
ncbi:aspartyl-phosphate phosphatase Spo0E family protein [Sporosarcina limicola]|uniref:Aspartyl-phosphate phosphatase Spo0E family protein n=1 Tax=Sporosarcina limicola TaxID=34101 RepID=A0A927MI85_9BACL|nr:aspartyl-phosphate phosphatase Spo0E family protein [Sporosarcina limicola]MBE1553642.1 hypothetical protein [Sporosarcina limicola]